MPSERPASSGFDAIINHEQPSHAPRHEYMDSLRAESEVVESFRASHGNVNPEQYHPMLDRALQLAEARDLSSEAARELVGAVAELTKATSTVSAEASFISDAFRRLKQAVYGTEDVQPVLLEDRRQPGAVPQPLKNNLDNPAIFEWHGTPIQLRARDHKDEQLSLPKGVQPNPDSKITLHLGEADTWYMQIGHQEPFTLPKDEPVTLGRHELGGNSHISRIHLTLTAVPPIGIEVIDHSAHGTHYATADYPDPAEFRTQHDQASVGRHRASADDSQERTQKARERLHEL